MPYLAKFVVFAKMNDPVESRAALLLHDGRQGGQDPGAAGELRGGGPEQGHRGTRPMLLSVFGLKFSKFRVYMRLGDE